MYVGHADRSMMEESENLLKTTIYQTFEYVQQEFLGTPHSLNIPNGLPTMHKPFAIDAQNILTWLYQPASLNLSNSFLMVSTFNDWI